MLGPPTVNLDGSLAAHPESDSRMTTSTSTTTVMITTAAITTSPPEAEDGVMRVLPTPELKTYVMSLRYPYSDVPIDVTGTGFRRMASLRRSFMQVEKHVRLPGNTRN